MKLPELCLGTNQVGTRVPLSKSFFRGTPGCILRFEDALLDCAVLGLSDCRADEMKDFSQLEVCWSTAFQNLRVAPRIVCRLRANMKVPIKKVAISHPKVVNPMLSDTICVLNIACETN